MSNNSLEFSVNATDNVDVSAVWVSVTTPNGVETLSLSRATLYTGTFTNTSYPGVYNVTVYVNDTAGNVNSTAVNFTVVSCLSNTDCGTDGYVGINYCGNNDVNRLNRSYTCSNPGTVTAACSYADTAILQNDCGDSTVVPQGTFSCSGNQVMRDVVIVNRGCDPINITCFLQNSQTSELVEVCGSGYVCSGGSCVGQGLNVSLDLNRSIAMRGWSVKASGSVENVSCTSCLNVSWGSMVHVVDVVSGLWSDDYVLSNTDSNMTVEARIGYGGQTGSASKSLFVSPAYSVTLSCNNSVLVSGAGQLCNASLQDIDLNTVAVGVTVEFSLDASRYVDDESPYSWAFNASNNTGNYTVYARANDSWNNTGSGSSRFEVLGAEADTIPPEITAFSVEPAQLVYGGVVNVSAEASDNQLVERMWIVYTKPSGDSVYYNYTHPYGYEPDMFGLYQVTLYVSDAAGNTVNESRYFTVLNPALIDLQPDHGSLIVPAGSLGEFAFTVNNSGEEDVNVSMESGSSWISFSIADFPLGPSSSIGVIASVSVPEGTQSGVYTLSVSAVTSNGLDASVLRVIVPDEEPPEINSVEYSEIISYGGNQTVSVEATDAIGIDSCLIDYGEGNKVMPGCSYTWAPSILGNISFTVYVNDSAGNSNSANGAFSVVDDVAPSLISWSITPGIVFVGGSVNITAEVADNYQVDKLWAEVAGERIELPGVYVADEAGSFNVSIYVNDSSGNTVNASGFFVSAEPFAFEVTVEDANGSAMDNIMIVYFPATGEIIDSSEFSGNLSVLLPDYVYDLEFEAFNNSFRVSFNGVNISDASGETIGMDFLSEPVAGFLETYAVQCPYNITNATIYIEYSGLGFRKEGNLKLYKCSGWNFTAQTCSTGWKLLKALQNKSGDYFEIDVDSLSAFSVKEETTQKRKDMSIKLNYSCVNKSAQLTAWENDDTPLQGGDVDVYLNGEKVLNMRTDVEGKASFTPTEEGLYRIVVDKSGYVSEEAEYQISSCPKPTTSTSTTSSISTVKVTSTSSSTATTRTKMSTTSSTRRTTTSSTTSSAPRTTTTTPSKKESTPSGIADQLILPLAILLLALVAILIYRLAKKGKGGKEGETPQSPANVVDSKP
jgi:hypothetical protein